ncbi:hypothetical protein [Flavobacterium hibisci]|uniref:hypothetical protein n=1 Tax=Flavobacterium hibisci TaxID=1914462 RepID=UPI001CBE0B34|nr:hypothetical protein [Flavobacterium hibisci]MBZ4042145.1 hypothetical protein [Flavobacterium hibisci]
MQQYNYQNNVLKIKVKKSPILVRIMMFGLAFSFFVFPLLGAIIGIANGSGLHIGYFITIGIFSLIGFYTLRMALWNTFGEETIQILEDRVIYEANYGWFKDGKKETSTSNLHFYALPVGYEEDNKGNLIIASDGIEVESVVNIEMTQLEELVSFLQHSI